MLFAVLIVNIECKTHGHSRPRSKFSTTYLTMVEYDFFWSTTSRLERLVTANVGGGKSNPLFTKSVYGPALYVYDKLQPVTICVFGKTASVL